MIEEALLTAIGDVTVQAARLEWLRAMVLVELKGGTVEHRLGLSRDRTTSWLQEGAAAGLCDDAGLMEALCQWASDSADLLNKRDAVIHAIWPIDDTDGLRYMVHRSAPRVTASHAEVRELAARIGGVTGRGVDVLNRVTLRP